MKPTVGKIVHYIMPDSPPRPIPGKYTPIAAIITLAEMRAGVDPRHPDWNALDENNYKVNLYVFYSGRDNTAYSPHHENVPYSYEYRPGFWSWTAIE